MSQIRKYFGKGLQRPELEFYVCLNVHHIIGQSAGI